MTDLKFEILSHIDIESKHIETAFSTVKSLMTNVQHLDIGENELHEILDLVLVLRLDLQDVLFQLLQTEQSLWQVLGITPKGQSAINIERIKYALGADDTLYVIRRLNTLMTKLKKEAHRKLMITKQERSQHHLDGTSKSLSTSMKINKHLSHAKPYVIAMKASLKQLTLELESIAGSSKNEIIHQNLMTLQGPISRYYQAIQSGLAVTAKMYEYFVLAPRTDLSLSPILQNTVMSPPKLFQGKVVPFDELEQRAELKRTRPFFNLGR